MRRLSLALTIIFSLAAMFACNSQAKVAIGTSKDEVVRVLGKPDNWVTIQNPNLPQQKVLISSYFSGVEAIRARQMPDNELWILEYARPDGSKYCLHLRHEKVIAQVEGPAL